jgi:hypothetical protein
MKKIIKATNDGNDIEVSAEGCIRLLQVEDGIAENEIYICCEQQWAELILALEEAAEVNGWSLE